MDKNIKLSVVMITYGHEEYITEAINGVLMQKCNFEIELIISNDNSPDNTDVVIRKLINNKLSPVKIKYFSNSVNKGMVENFRWSLHLAQGKYVAMCEGDDYWTDPLKLQKQVDFLEANPEYYSCFSAYNVIQFDKKTIRTKVEMPKKHNLVSKNGFTFGLLDFQNYFIPRTLTGVFRRNIFDQVDLTKYSYFRDLHLFYHLLKDRKAFYFFEPYGVYRIHPGGVNSMKEGLNNNLAAYNCYKELYQINDDNFCRVKYFQSIHALLKFSIYNDFDGNTIKYKFDLYFKMIKLLRNFKEIKLMLSVFVLRMNFINK